jgi:hypothetical protein
LGTSSVDFHQHLTNWLKSFSIDRTMIQICM